MAVNPNYLKNLPATNLNQEKAETKMIEAVDGEETVLYVNDVQTFVTPPIMEFVLSGANDDDVEDDIVVR